MANIFTGEKIKFIKIKKNKYSFYLTIIFLKKKKKFVNKKKNIK